MAIFEANFTKYMYLRNRFSNFVSAHLPIIYPLQSGGNTTDEINLYPPCLLTYLSMWCFLCRSPVYQGLMCHNAAFSLETYISTLLDVAIGG